MVTRSALVDYIVSHQPTLINIDFTREIWMIPDRLVGEVLNESDFTFTITSESPLYIGKLFVSGKFFYGVKEFQRIDNHDTDIKRYRVVAEKTGINYDPSESKPLCTPQDVTYFNPGEIANLQGNDVISTTIGRLIANYLFLVYPFGDKVPYLNEEFTTAKLEKRISDRLLRDEISTQDVKTKYINTLSLFGQANEMICPNISEKTITIPQSIYDLRKRLVNDNRIALEAGNVSVMSDIEKQLIQAYREYLKGDSSLHFLLKKKYFDVVLKKLFLTQGMTEVFGSQGKFTFIENPMGNGWKIENLPEIFNEVRAGSYARAVETANGGVIAKLILRVFQDTRITIDDCEATRGEQVDATLENLQDFMRNYVINADGSTSLINEDTIHSFVGKTVTIRTPGYCTSTKGFCAKCFGQTFEQLGQKAFAPVANDFARTQTTNSLKMMHGKSHSTFEISDINRYLIK